MRVKQIVFVDTFACPGLLFSSSSIHVKYTLGFRAEMFERVIESNW